MIVVHLERTAGPHKIFLDSTVIGNDFLVSVYGGDEHHIGGVAVAYPTKSHYRDRSVINVNTINLPGHKDYLLANTTAEKICKALSKPTIVTVGIHIDNASAVELDEVIDSVDMLVKQFIDHYQNAE
jgi:hypothetical protein